MNAGPMLPSQMRVTFEVARPFDTHWKVVDCATAAAAGECEHYAHGFVLEFNPADPDLQANLAALTAAGYRWKEGDATHTPGFRAFYFPPEQRCLSSRRNPHVIPRDRAPLMRVVAGDYRAMGPVQSVHTRETDWVDQLRNHADALDTAQKRG